MIFPNFNIPAAIRMHPARKDASNIPCMPYLAAIVIRIAVMAPVGPEIWKEAPDNPPITTPAMTAVTRPAAAVAPELTPKARARGRATAATVTPDKRSLENRPLS